MHSLSYPQGYTQFDDSPYVILYRIQSHADLFVYKTVDINDDRQ